MNSTIQFIIFLKFFATGIMAPVLTRVLIAHGASISTISLLIGAYSFTVIAAEFPSGVFADLYGRKKAFMLSAALFFLCYCVLLFSQSVVVLFCAMIANGLGRAFSSGSIDALAIDAAGTTDAALIRTTARLSILESAGLAAGALAGGFISALGTSFAGNIGVNIGVYALLFILTLVCVHEPPRTLASGEESIGPGSFSAQVKGSFTFMLQKGTVRTLFVFSLVTGFALISLETYWQPALALLQPSAWVFGALSFGGYACVILGSRLAQRILTKHADCGAALLLALKALFGFGLILLVFRFRQLGFIAVYLLIFFFLGGGGVAENLLLNRLIPSYQRASVLSLSSFVLQIGGLIASVSGYMVSVQGNFRNMWLIAGAMIILAAGAFTFIHLKQRKRSHESYPRL